MAGSDRLRSRIRIVGFDHGFRPPAPRSRRRGDGRVRVLSSGGAVGQCGGFTRVGARVRFSLRTSLDIAFGARGGARAGRLRAQRFQQIVDPRRRIEYESRPRVARHHAGAKALGANQVAIGVRDVRVLRGEPRISLQLPDGAFPLARHAEQSKQRPTARRIDGPGAHRGLRSREPRVERRIVRPGRRARAGRRREGGRRHAPCSEVATGAGSGLSIASV